ncbi:MAG TPA: aldehyde dehydrogenase family protein, partial [Rubrivivax sp.]|nr:aldehyde dehydrogenase family protein [Rubrivivax sp.]
HGAHQPVGQLAGAAARLLEGRGHRRDGAGDEDVALAGEAVADGVGKCFLNSGQTCTALTRMLVPRDRLAEVEGIAAATAAAFTPGR